MKYLQSVQNDYPILGISFNQSFEEKYPFNKQNRNTFFVLGLAIISNFVYFFHVAKTIDEFTFSIFTLTSLIVVTVVYGIVLWKLKSMSVIYNAVVKLTDESKIFRHFYL